MEHLSFQYFQLNYEASFLTRFEEILKIINFDVHRFDEWRMWGPVKTDWEFRFVFDEAGCLELLTPAENDYFGQRLECTAPKPWLKYWNIEN